jgi:hypothetical protein
MVYIRSEQQLSKKKKKKNNKETQEFHLQTGFNLHQTRVPEDIYSSGSFRFVKVFSFVVQFDPVEV